METALLRAKFLDVLIHCVGKPYRWGGNGPDNFDCSGLVCFALRQVFPDIPDMNCNMLYDRYHNCKKLMSKAAPGDLCLYGHDGALTHVMVVLNKWDENRAVIIGARGGDHTTTSDARAYDRGAMVSVVGINYRLRDLTFVVDPFYETN